MATNINYPAVNLPCPLLSGNTYQPGTTFIRSEFDYAIRQRKQYCAQYSVGFSFVIKSQIQMETFKDFFYNTLNYGVNSFLADWEIEGMDGIKEFRFSSNYTTVALGASRYRITASFDMITKIKGLFVIPSIQYNMDIISTELDGTRYIKNDGKGGNSFNAEALASNHIYLNGTTQSVPYPVLHELGSDTLNTIAPTEINDNEITTFTSDTSNNFDLAVTTIGTSGNHPRVVTNGIDMDGKYVLVAYDIVVNSGTCILATGLINGVEIAPEHRNQTLETGHYEMLQLVSGTSTAHQLYFNGTNLFDISVTNWTVKEITLPTLSYLTYFDSTTNTLTELSSTGDVGELILDDDFSEGPTGWSAASDATISVDEERLKVLVDTGTTHGVATKQITCVVGRRYEIDLDYTIGDNTTAYLWVGTTATGGTASDMLDLTLSSGSNIGYFEATVTNVYVNFDVVEDGTHAFFDNVKAVESLPISTTYSVTDSHQFVFNHTSPISAADKLAIEQDPNLAFRMFFDGEVLPSGFSSTDVGWFSGGNGGLQALGYEPDLKYLSTDILRTNLALYSSDYTNAIWAVVDATVSEGSLSPDNINNADRLIATSIAGGLRQRPTQEDGVLVTNSFWIKGISGSMAIRLTNTNNSYTTETLTGEWQRLQITVVSSGALGRAYASMPLSGDVVDIWGYQFEENPMATDYLPTTTTSETDGTIAFEDAYVKIEDYDTVVRETLANQSNGASNLKLIQDVSGRTTGIAVANTTQWKADGRTAVTNWTITAPFTITEPIDGDVYTFTSTGNRYKNSVADGTYTLPTGIWTLDEFGFDGVTSVTARGITKKINEIVVP